MKKRILSCLMVLSMLATVMYAPVSASTGVIVGEGNTYADIVEYYNDGSASTGFTGFAWTSNGVIGIDETSGSTRQAFIKDLPTDTTDEDTYGYLAFKIQPSSEGTNSAVIVSVYTAVPADAPEGTTEGTYQVPVFAVSPKSMGMTDPVNYSTAQTFDGGAAYTIGNWYTIGICVNKNETVDIYVDGEKSQTVSFGDSKKLDPNSSTVSIMMNSIKNSLNYLDEITWGNHSETSFIAVADKTKAASGEVIRVKFTEPIGSLDSSKITVYNCASGAEVSGIGVTQNGDVLELTMPQGLEEGQEYRIDLAGVKGALGRTPYNDSIFFNCPMESGVSLTDYVVYETFEGYSKLTPRAALGEYYYPEGWKLGERYNNYTCYIKPYDDSANGHGTVVNIGQEEATLDWTKCNENTVYLPLDAKYSTGMVTLEYDIKPLKTSALGLDGANANLGLLVMVYPEYAPATDYADTTAGSVVYIGTSGTTDSRFGRVVSGIIGTSIGNPTGNVAEGNVGQGARWISHKDFGASQSLNEDWYTVKVEMNFDAGTMKWYLDGVEQGTSSTLMSNLGITSISAISFGTKGRTNQASSLIDNVTVTRTYDKKLSEESEIFSDYFDNFENNGENGKWLWSAPTGGIAGYAPKGWAAHQIWENSNQHYGSISTAVTGKESNALKIGKNLLTADSRNESPVLYHKLDDVYDSGIINISYDIKADKLITTDDYASLKTTIEGFGSDMATWRLSTGTTNIAARQFFLSLTPDIVDAEGLTSNVAAPQSWQGNNLGKHIFGIANGEFAAFIEPMFVVAADGGSADYESYKHIINDIQYWQAANYRKDVELEEWYSIKHTIDLDNGYVKTYIGNELVSVASTAALGITQIGGVSFSTDSNAFDSEVVVDNVVVTAQKYEEETGGVMQVRFSDYYDKTYGPVNTLTTVADTVEVKFWSTLMDASSFNNTTVMLVNTEDNTEIDYDGVFDEDTDIYTMNLNEYLTKDTEYKLIVNGVTSNGYALDSYEMTIKSDADGVLIVEPLYIWKNATDVTGTSGSLAEDDTVTTGTRLINTTGEKKDYEFFVAYYAGDELYKADFAKIEQDGYSSADNKDANIASYFTLSADDAAKVTKVKTFLWNGSMSPVLTPAEFTIAE